jgi:general secretion pathway protein B
MSLILDALRKSERTRQQSLTGQLGSGELPTGPSRLPVPWLPVITAILIANALLLYFLWPHPAPVTPAQTAAASALPAAVPYHPAVRSLAAEAISPDDTPAAPARPIPVPAPVSHLAPPGNPSAVSAQSAAIPAGLGALQSIDELPPEVRQSLPALHMDVHGYAGNPAERFVVINLKTYRIGNTLAEGPVLKDIVPQGAVLEFHGVTFLLPPS